METTIEEASRLLKESKKIFIKLYEENQGGYTSAFMHELEDAQEDAIKNQKAEFIQEITQDEELTQKLMDKLYGHYGRYIPLQRSK